MERKHYTKLNEMISPFQSYINIIQKCTKLCLGGRGAIKSHIVSYNWSLLPAKEKQETMSVQD